MSPLGNYNCHFGLKSTMQNINAATDFTRYIAFSQAPEISQSKSKVQSAALPTDPLLRELRLICQFK